MVFYNPGLKAVKYTAGRTARRHHADDHAHDGHPLDGAMDGKAYYLKTK